MLLRTDAWGHRLDRTDCQDVSRDKFDLMGYSLRTSEYRITEWRYWDGAKLAGRWDVLAPVNLYPDISKATVCT